MKNLTAARAPRYTSYPPATHFTDSVGPDRAAAWLGAIEHGTDVSLYVHIPFCRRLCWFCACRTQGTKTDSPLIPYLDALQTEMDLVAQHLPAGLRIRQIHLGGGTPTILPPSLIDRMFGMIKAAFPYSAGTEVSVEIDPTEIDDARLDALARAGMTRASLGVQDFEPDIQRAIGRAQSIAETRFAIDGLRARGVSGINLDLLYGLPKQTRATLDRTLDAVIDLLPDRLALYGYAHVPWASRRQVMIKEDDLPDTDARLALSRQASGRLRLAGYRAIGFDHFARPGDPMAVAAKDGTLRRNFQGYTVDPAPVLIGLGASAISRLPGGYTQNAASTGEWAARLKSGRLPAARGHALSIDVRLRGDVIERLLCDFAITPSHFDDPARVTALTQDMASQWPDDATLDTDGCLQVRKASRHLVRLIAMSIDRYAAPEGRHSLAI